MADGKPDNSEPGLRIEQLRAESRIKNRWRLLIGAIMFLVGLALFGIYVQLTVGVPDKNWLAAVLWGIGCLVIMLIVVLLPLVGEAIGGSIADYLIARRSRCNNGDDS